MSRLLVNKDPQVNLSQLKYNSKQSKLQSKLVCIKLIRQK